jgi:flagellar hook-length control protein FliK
LQDATTLDETRQEAEGHAREAPPRPAPGAASRPAETASATVQRSTPARAAADPPAVSPVASPAPGARLSSAVTVGEPMPAVERRPASPERPLEGRGAGPAGFTVLEAPTGAVSPSPGDPPAAEGRPPAPLRSPAVLEQVLDGARWLARPGRHEISLRLEPPELGAVHVRATLESGVLEIRIRAEVEPVQQALQQDLPRLRAALVELGLAPGRLTVELGLGGSRQEPGGWPGSADESSSRQPWRPAARGATIRPLPGVARLERWA